MLRLVVALLVAVLTSSSIAPLTCAGWEPAPAARMACCQRAAHDCSDQAAADACCAQQEQAHQPATALSAGAHWIGAPSPAVAAIAVAPDVCSIDSRLSRPCEASAALQLHAPPGSFELPLRI